MATEFVGIELNLMGYEGVRADLQNLDRLLNSFRGKKKFDAGFSEAKAQVVAYKGELERLQRVQETLAKKGVFSEGLNNKIGEVTNKLRDAQQAVREFGTASRNAGQTFKQTFRSISSEISHVGGAMQSLGNALTRLTNPFRRITSGLLMGAGYKALNLFTEGLSNTFERSDTMRNYNRSLSELGLDVSQTFKLMSDEALTARDNLDLAVQGLPTSLDEIMAAQKVYAGATGEMVSSTKTAIAANNAFLASSTDARQQRVLQRYFVALASGANLTSMQWAAMQRNMPLAFRKIGEAMGYMDVDSLKNDLASSNEKAQEFLKTFQELGTTGVIKNAAMVMTKSWSGLSSNIRIAVTRMGQGILDTLNSTFEKATGRDLLSHLLGIDKNGKEVGGGIKHWINNISSAVQGWIEKHPEELVSFFETLKNIDWASIARGFAESALAIAQFGANIAKLAEGKDLSWIGRWLTRLSIAGRGLSIFGGVLKGLRHPLAFLFTVGKFTGGKIGKMGIFGKIASIFGKKKDITAAGEAAEAIPTVATTFRSALKSLEGLMKVAGAITIVSGTGFVAFKAVKSMVHDFKDIVSELRGMSAAEVNTGAEVLAAMATFFGGMALVGSAIGKVKGSEKVAGQILKGEAIIGAVTTLAAVIAKADMALMSSAFKDFANATSYMQKGIDNLKSLKGLTDAGGIANKVASTVKGFNLIIEAMSGKYVDKGKKEGGLDELGKDKVASLKNLADAVSNMQSVVTNLNQLATMGIQQNIGSKMEQIRKTLDTVTSIVNGERVGNAIQGGIKTVGKGKANSLKNLSDAVGHMKTLVNNLNAVATMGIQQNVGSKMQQIAKAIQQVQTALPTMMGNITGPKNLMNNAKNFAAGVKNLGTLVSRINSLASQSVNVDGFGELVQGIKDALAQLEGMSEILELDIEVKLSPNFQRSVKDTVNKINKANRQISNAVNGIQTSYSKTVTVHLQTRVNASSAAAGIASGAASAMSGVLSKIPSSMGSVIGHASGGLIYRAKGGNVPFRRRGTDTVPAMLTPGEYVHNKQAVNTFGLDFMRKVNNLDVKGAMGELMHRAGGMANVNRGTVITNNYNNNQKVTINNNNPTGAGFTFKSASRFVGAF